MSRPLEVFDLSTYRTIYVWGYRHVVKRLRGREMEKGGKIWDCPQFTRVQEG